MHCDLRLHLSNTSNVDVQQLCGQKYISTDLGKAGNRLVGEAKEESILQTVAYCFKKERTTEKGCSKGNEVVDI